MPKLLFFSDIHIAAHKGSQERLQDCLDTLDWVFATARRHGVADIVFGGDLFQDRQKIQVLAYNKTFDVIAKNSDINLFLLLGNHDLWYHESTEVSSVHPLSALRHVTVISEPSTVKVGDFPVDFLPFTNNPIPALKTWERKSPVLVGHVAVDKAIMNARHGTRSDVSVESDAEMVAVSRDQFKGWQRVFLGHYHFGQPLTDQAEYIGSPLQLNFGEADQTKHVILMDTETLEKEYICNDFSPKHLILDAEDVPDDLGKNFVRIKSRDLLSADIVDLKARLRSSSPEAQITLALREEEEVDGKRDERKKKFNLADGDLLERFVASSDSGLDPAELIRLGKDICDEN